MAILLTGIGPQGVRAQPQQPLAAAPTANQGAPTQVSGVTVVAHRPTPLDGLTVTASACPEPDPARYPAREPPWVIDSYPAEGAVVAPGVVMVRVTFNAPMACYWAVESQGGEDKAPCEPAGAWELPGRSTWRMKCKLTPGGEYKVRFGAIDGHHFVGLSGLEAQGYTLRFSASDTTPATTTTAAALAADPGPPTPARVTAYVTCTDRRFDSGQAPCERRGVAEP